MARAAVATVRTLAVTSRASGDLIVCPLREVVTGLRRWAWNAATAERNAALLVASNQAEWRKEHGRERVPPAETEDMINRAIAEAATAFGVPATSIAKDRIRIALKAGRI